MLPKLFNRQLLQATNYKNKTTDNLILGNFLSCFLIEPSTFCLMNCPILVEENAKLPGESQVTGIFNHQRHKMALCCFQTSNKQF